MATAILLALIVGYAGWVVWRMWRKRGSCSGCGNCPYAGSCHEPHSRKEKSHE